MPFTSLENKLYKIPYRIGELKTLEILDFTNNEISEFSKSISNLKNLKELRIPFQKLSIDDRIELKNLLPKNCKIIE